MGGGLLHAQATIGRASKPLAPCSVLRQAPLGSGRFADNRLACSRVLQKYEIGMLDPKEVTVTYQKQGSTDVLHIELKREVEAYFRANKVRCFGPATAS